jgi:hypothetical protein
MRMPRAGLAISGLRHPLHPENQISGPKKERRNFLIECGLNRRRDSQT